MPITQTNGSNRNQSGQVFIRERFTNILVRLASIERDQTTSGITDPDYQSLRDEAKKILAIYPEWNDIAKEWTSFS